MNSPPLNYRWHLGMADQPRTEHLAVQGQTPRVSQPYTSRWVWSACAQPVSEHPITKPVARDRCQKCLDWLRSNGK